MTFEGLTRSIPAECGSKQTIQVRPDHSERVVSPSRGLPVDMHQVAPSLDRPVCNDVQQVTSVCVTSFMLPSLGSRCTQSALGGPGPICLSTSSHSGQSGGEAKALPLQENHSNYARFAQHALVLGSNGHIQPNRVCLLKLLFDQIPNKHVSNLKLQAWLFEHQVPGFSEVVTARIKAPQSLNQTSI